MKNVYLFEINDVLTGQIKLPYSTGVIWSYCIAEKTISENYKLDGWFYYRQDIEEILDQIKEPSVLGFNCFVWNWNFNNQLAKRIKEKYPNCLIVYGGWQVPMSDRNENFFKDHPYVDIAVHGEGEITFKEILIENLKANPVWENIAGCSVPMKMVGDSSKGVHRKISHGLKLIDEERINYDELTTHVNLPRERIKDLNSMPSPYLDGLFDKLVADCPYEIEAAIETTRGCPYQCAFCEISTKYYQRIRWQKLDKVFKEIDWLSKNKVVFVYNADSNFGMLPEHLEITKYFVKKKNETGYPQKHRCDWAKNGADKVIELAKLFYDADMDKGITIALQSLNPYTLKAVRRKNVDDGKLANFFSLYSQEELPSYVELIMGLPEETLETFIDGICKVIDLGQHNYIGIYPLTALPNTPFGDPEYINKYELNIIDTYPAFSHVDINEQNNFEREHMVVGSKTLTIEDYIECTVYRWFFMFAHYLGNLQFVSRFLNSYMDISFKDFYLSLMEHIKNMDHDSFLYRELNKTKQSLQLVMKAEHPWGRVLEDVRNNFAWDFEEATSIRIAQNKEKFQKEIKEFIKVCYNLNDDLLEQLISYQDFAILDPNRVYPIKKDFSYNIHDVIFKNCELTESNNKLQFTAKNYNGNYFEWGKETLWWGRRVAACKAKVEVL
jgi:putative methyltransferase